MTLLSVGASPELFRDFPVHRHDCCEIILNTEGEGTARISGREYPFKPGTIHIIPPHTEHKKNAEQGFRDVYLHTDRLPGSHSGEPVVLRDDDSHTMEKLFSILLARYSTESNPDPITNTLYEVVLNLIEQWTKVTKRDPVIENLTAMIRSSHTNPAFRASDALAASGYQKDHIRRRFIRAIGMTPTAYLTDIRLRHAKQLLQKNDALHFPIGEIAYLCGFDDPAYFCRIFKSTVGVSPTAFIRRKEV